MSTAGARLPVPGDVLLDASFQRVSPRAAARAGVRGLIRYTAGAATAPAHPSHGDVARKLITEREFAGVTAADLDVVANDEWYSTRIQEGKPAAELDAAAAARFWRRCGLAPAAAIYPSWDAAPVRELWPVVDAYLTAYAHVIASEGYALGVYAGTPYLAHALDAGIIGAGWRPDAGDWSRDGIAWQPNTRTARRRRRLVAEFAKHSPAALVQTGNTWFGGGADENLVIRTPIGSHLEAQAGAVGHHHHHEPPPKPPAIVPAAAAVESPKGAFRLTLDDHGAVHIIDAHGRPA